ncbi:unnamed protein product [Ambrosiozyma monospora]|uniref:Unnamed protein product n=1 Tax=Ambrosiozyma monospora TaxID=43982 RepID=A0ACB5U1G6_AMBMO|nr:unnamed protein product [Ambrosiozyma monospora]
MKLKYRNDYNVHPWFYKFTSIGDLNQLRFLQLELESRSRKLELPPLPTGLETLHLRFSLCDPSFEIGNINGTVGPVGSSGALVVDVLNSGNDLNKSELLEFEFFFKFSTMNAAIDDPELVQLIGHSTNYELGRLSIEGDCIENLVLNMTQLKFDRVNSFTLSTVQPMCVSILLNDVSSRLTNFKLIAHSMNNNGNRNEFMTSNGGGITNDMITGLTRSNGPSFYHIANGTLEQYNTTRNRPQI